MQNFSPEYVMNKLQELEQASLRHIPVGEGTESDLAKRVAALEEYKALNENGASIEQLAERLAALEKLSASFELSHQNITERLVHLEQGIVAAGAGAVQETGATDPALKPQTIDAQAVGEYSGPTDA